MATWSFTGFFILLFLFLFTFISFSSRKYEISRSTTCEKRDLSFFFFFFPRLVWSLQSFFGGGVGVLHIKPVFLFLFLNPIHLGFGNSGDGDYYGSVPFLLRTMAQEMRQAEEDVLECIFLLSTKIMRSVFMYLSGLELKALKI